MTIRSSVTPGSPPRKLTQLSAWVWSTHPVPSLVVAGLTTLFAWSVGLPVGQVVLVFFAMLANQTSIGLGNDWWDQPADTAAGRGDKPLANGVLSVRVVRNTSFVLSAVALGLSGVLGPWALACQAVMLGAGWWYNLHAKRHWTSPLSYLLGFGLLPIFPTLALTPVALPPGWVIVVAGLLGISAHFANALPDFHTDAAQGIRGLPQVLGPRLSGTVLVVGVVGATLAITVFGTTLPLWVRVLTAALALLAAVIAAALAVRPIPPRVIFPLVMASAVVCTGAIAAHFFLSGVG